MYGYGAGVAAGSDDVDGKNNSCHTLGSDFRRVEAEREIGRWRRPLQARIETNQSIIADLDESLAQPSAMIRHPFESRDW